MDRYQNHIYVSLLLHSLVETVKSDEESDESDELRRTKHRKDLLTINHRENSKYLEAHKILRKQKLHVAVEPVSVFLLEKGLQINSRTFCLFKLVRVLIYYYFLWKT